VKPAGASWVQRAWGWLLGGLVFVVLAQVLVSLAVELLPVVLVAAAVTFSLSWWRSSQRW